MTTSMLLPTHSGHTTRLQTMPSSAAKNGFAELVETVARSSKPVLITRNKRPAVVVLSVDEYQRLLGAAPDPLAPLRDRFASIVTGMQTEPAKQAVDALFAATPAQLGKAATKAAGKPRR
ncbi:type II toxin-antitoxin system Phd/YefM family antitoxin [Rhodanobacter sp. Col0626]|uniref:type II toxin-antitoxin system Phd/YefM family antitoxin n=1 Tax=Rhodanobacter sp. Col0626 TaxID=3415679 RepID=UPI003CEC315A